MISDFFRIFAADFQFVTIMKRLLPVFVLCLFAFAACETNEPKRGGVDIFPVIGKTYFCEIQPLAYGISQFEFHQDSTCTLAFEGLEEPNITSLISGCEFAQVANEVSITSQNIDSVIHIHSLNDSTIEHCGVKFIFRR